MTKIDDIEKMLRALVNSVSGFKQESLSFRKEVLQRFDEVDKKIEGSETRLTKRIDSIGKQLAYLEDDAPTRDEFSKLEKRVGKLEQKPAAL